VERLRRELEHVPLATAAATVHIQLTGAPPNPTPPAVMRDVLDQVAQAISNIVPIYAQEPGTAVPVKIPPPELLDAQFLRGAHLLVTKAGKEYRGLSVQRRDMMEAIAVLKRIRFTTRRVTFS
jgi:hypothetical protein